MSELGSISSYMLAIKQVQVSLLKNTAEMQQKTIEVLLGDDTNRISANDMVGKNVDVRL